MLLSAAADRNAVASFFLLHNGSGLVTPHGKVEGAIGLSTTRRMRSEGKQLVEMVQWAAAEASAQFGDDARNRKVATGGADA